MERVIPPAQPASDPVNGVTFIFAYGDYNAVSGTKHYFGDGQQLATRLAEGDVYYHLNDPTGTSLVLVDANGDEAGRMVYDGYGMPLTNTLPLTLTGTLPDLPDAATGLVHLGDGRWYDPALGRPLQPNAAGGPPTLPQALNRYAATPLGQPGVYEAAQSTWNPFDDAYTSNTGKALVSDQINEAVKRGLYAYLRKSAYTIVGDPIVDTVVRAVPKSELLDRVLRKAGPGLLFGLSFAPESMQQAGHRLVNKTIAANLRPELDEVVIGYSFSYGHNLPAGRVVGKLLASKLGLNLLDAGIGFGIDVGYQLWLDSSTPYLNNTQRLQRAFWGQGIGSLVSFGIGKGAAKLVGAAIAGPVGLVIGVGVSIAWDLWIAPRIYERLGAVPTRQLAPLNQ